jgi:hypothetical protein
MRKLGATTLKHSGRGLKRECGFHYGRVLYANTTLGLKSMIIIFKYIEVLKMINYITYGSCLNSSLNEEAKQILIPADTKDEMKFNES